MVWLRIKIKVGEREIETSAIANSGYSAESAEIAIPWKLAEMLIPPHLIEKAQSKKYSTPAGEIEVLKLNKVAEVILCDEDIKVSDVNIAIDEHLSKVLLNDKILSELRIVIIDPSKGIWCIRDESPPKLRESALEEYW